MLVAMVYQPGYANELLIMKTHYRRHHHIYKQTSIFLYRQASVPPHNAT